MNKVKHTSNDEAGRDAAKRTRAYDSTHRQEQARLTRERILEAAVREISSGGAADVTLAQVARAAGVSEPTLYRHFGSRDHLFDELDSHAQRTMGLPTPSYSFEDTARQVGPLFEKFETHSDLLHAVTQTRVGKEMRARGRARRYGKIRDMVATEAPHLDADAVERTAAVLRLLISWESFQTLTRELGLSTDEASRAVSWAVETLSRDLTKKGDGPGGRRQTKNKRAKGSDR